MARYLFAVRSIVASAALMLPAVSQAAVVHCLGTDLDTYWKFEPNGSGVDARFWESGRWSRNVCTDAPFGGGGGYECKVYPERYVFTFWKLTAGSSDNYHTTERIEFGRADGSYFKGWWDRPDMADFSGTTEGTCTLSAEPAPAKPVF